jgi:AraC-like DNA-binding protein
MKALYENVESKKGDTSFVAYHSVVPYFDFKWHYHPEYELTLITKGSGKRLVGDSFESFTEGDLVLLGQGLPHTWTSEPLEKKKVSAVVIQFSQEFISSFLKHTEFNDITKLLAQSATGLFFPSDECRSLIKKIQKLPEKEGVNRVTALLNILQQLAEQNPQELATKFFTSAKSKENEVRINKVFRYIQEHSSGNINLEKAASLVHLTDSAFCKFFKRVTGKTFSDYVNDIRIGNACRLLTDSDRTVNEIAFESGIETLTYFNRVFLKKKGMTPGTFRKSIRLSS